MCSEIDGRRKRPMSAWAEQPSGGSPAGARPRPASALPLQMPCAAQAGDAGHVSEPEKLFWTPPKAWMLACMDKGMPLHKKKTRSCPGVVEGLGFHAPAHQHYSSKCFNNHDFNNKCQSHRSAGTSCAFAVMIVDELFLESRQT